MAVDWELELKKPPDVVEELTVLLKEVVEFEGFVEVKALSSSRSFSFANTLHSCLCLSSSSRNCSDNTNVLFLFTKLEVPALPETLQSIPFQLLLKLLYMFFNLSNALISCGFL